eukprot:622441-Prymnesium_polylepis.1
MLSPHRLRPLRWWRRLWWRLRLAGGGGPLSGESFSAAFELCVGRHVIGSLTCGNTVGEPLVDDVAQLGAHPGDSEGQQLAAAGAFGRRPLLARGLE